MIGSKQDDSEESLSDAFKVWWEDYDREQLPIVWHGDFLTLTELREHCRKNKVGLPSWVWAVERVGFLLDAEEILALAKDQDEHPVRDLIPHEAVARLQELLDTWAMELTLEAYEVNYDRVVVFDRSLFGS